MPPTAHYTTTWFTSETTTQRLWTQHYCASTHMPHCVYCLALHYPMVDSPFCSEGCAASYNVRNNIRSSQLTGHGHGCLGL